MMKTFSVLLVIIGGLQNAYTDKLCEAELIKECQVAQKELYERANEQKPLKQLYCENSQELMNCLVTDPDCKGEEIDKYRYTNLEYNVMSLRTRLCPGLETERLAELVPKELRHAHAEIDDLDPDHALLDARATTIVSHRIFDANAAQLLKDGDKGSQCAMDIHWKCVRGLISKLHDPDVKLCAAVKTAFVNCYDREMSAEIEACSSQLLAHFHHILTHLNKEVLSDVDGREDLGC